MKHKQDELDRLAVVLALAGSHNVHLSINGEKLRMIQEPRSDEAGLDVIFRVIGKQKDMVMAALDNPDATRTWLSRTQRWLTEVKDEMFEMLDQWEQVEKMHRLMHEDTTRCVNKDGRCDDYAMVRCDVCAGKGVTA